MKTKLIIAATLTLMTTTAIAAPQLYDQQTGKYLGNLSSNQFDPNSTSNEFGRYGSRFSPDSINNEFGQYGSRFSNKSANNPYATQAPVIYDNGGYDQ
jgi:hypothetical protein